MNTPLVQYAIVDGAVEEDLLDFLRKNNPPHCCLYPPPVQPDLVALAPYLIGVTEEVAQWLNTKNSPWGIYVESERKFHLLVQHFRRYLWVGIPDQSKPVLFRFYDPRNIWTLISILTPRELFMLVEPINKICTRYTNEERESDFSSLRNANAKNISEKDKVMLTFTHRQYALLNKQSQDNYIEKLASYIQDYYLSKNKSVSDNLQYLKQFAEDCFMFCLSLNINDDVSIRGMTFLILSNDIGNIEDIPQEWITRLNDPDTSMHNQVEMLLLQELGFIPQ